MTPYQGTIYIEKGKIRGLKPEKSKLIIISKNDNIEYNYGNSYAIPGLVDSHGHIAALGKMLNGLSLTDCLSAEQCAIKASHHNILRGDWIVGSGWNQESWLDTSYPHKNILDSYFPDNPVYLMRVDGHTCWVNSMALKMAGIDRFTPDLPGGTIEKDKSGNPTGILIDNAFLLIKKFIPKHSLSQVESFIIDASKELSENGLTEVHDMDVAPELIPIYQKLEKENKLKIRIQSYITAQNDEYQNNNIQVYESEYFSIRGIKFYADGALGSHGAALLEPYSDKASSNGLLLIDEKALYRKAKNGIERGFQIATHAIGDAANKMVLNAYMKLRKENITNIYATLRIEHAQIVTPKDQLLFGKYGIIAAVQPLQFVSDKTMAPKRLGSRMRYSYPWKSLMENGTLLLGGSDFPIESHNPFYGIDAFINRSDDTEALKIDDAFDTYTKNPHKTIMSDITRGEIKENMDADICILDKNPNQQKTSFKELRPLAVFCSGRQTFPKK